MSGLTAAVELSKHSDKFEVQILEARNRVGGRLFTNNEAFDTAIDMGGSWIHGINGNPIADLVEEAGIHTFCTDNMTVYLSDGSPIATPSCELLFEMIWVVIDRIKDHELAQSFTDSATDISVNDFIKDNRDYLLAKTPVIYHDVVLKSVIEMQSYYAGYWGDISIGALPVDTEFEGDHLVLHEGYGTLLNFIIEKHGLGPMINLQTAVTEIEYNETGVCIKTFNYESETTAEIKADVVIVTVPLGVLKAEKIKFTPDLPKPKASAIKNLGFGTYDKIFVEFEEPVAAFWPTKDADSFWIVPVWNEDSNLYADQTMPYRQRDQSHIGIEVYNMENMNQRAMIVMLFYGDAAEMVETIAASEGEAGLKKFVYEKLGRALNRPIPPIKKVLATNWKTDPFSCGSFSNIPVGASGKDMDDLAEPIMNRVYFAGEATFRKHYSTVHGAYFSGLRDANRIIEEYN